MSRALFIGDSHTCGYVTVPDKTGPGSYTYWNDNNYAEIYNTVNNKPVCIYAHAGTTNRMYTDWMKNMFNKFSDIDEVFLCLAPLNRFVLAFDEQLQDDALPLDYFMHECVESTDAVKKYVDILIKDNKIQLYNKPTNDDYNFFPGIKISEKNGLEEPDIRKHTFMQVKLFFELNTHLERRDFLLNVFAWDRICAENNAKLYLFNFMNRLKWPKSFEYYGQLNNTTVAEKSIEQYMLDNNVNPVEYLLHDKEHYNEEYHKKIVEKYIPWLKNQKKS
jgi:hypothetical protein